VFGDTVVSLKAVTSPSTVAIGDPPPKEPPQPGAVALGGSLLTTTFNLGEQAVDSDTPT